jgi:hypothetical protein
MRETTLTEFASRQSAIRHFLDEYRSWVRSKLGCRMVEADHLELGFSFAQLREANILGSQRAYERSGEVSGRELADAMGSLCRRMTAAAERKPGAGFSASIETGLPQTLLNCTEQGGEL